MLVTVLGDIGPWSEHVYLAGGMAPMYLIKDLPEGASPHVGTTDVDLVISLSVTGDDVEAYRTLHNNLKSADFQQGPADFQWRRSVDESVVLVEFLCETDSVAPGRIHKPKQGYGSKLGAFNVVGAELTALDYIEVEIEGERLDHGGRSRVLLRVANLLPFVVLKIGAFQDRHANKDSYDVVYTIRNWPEGPRAAGKLAAASPVHDEDAATTAIALLGERFADRDQDGPAAYANFLVSTGADPDEMRLEAVAVIREFLAGFND